MAALAQERAVGVPPASGRWSTAQHLFKLDCGQHMTWRSMDAVAKSCRMGRTLPCTLCGGQGGMPSGEWEVWQALRVHPSLRDTFVLHNDFLGEGCPCSIDVGICCTRTRVLLLVVQVDGAQHMHRQMHTTSVEVQRGRDDAFDTWALEKGVPVLRIHYLDIPWIEVWLAIALQAVRSTPGVRFIMYSTKMNRAPRTL